MLSIKTFSHLFLCVAAVVLFPVLAFAAGSHHGIESLTLPVFNFTIFVVLFAIIYRKLLAPQIKARSLDIREQVKTSGQALRNIEADLSTLRDRLSEIVAEKEETVNNYDAEGDALARLIIARANENAKSLAKDTARRVEQEFKHATAQVKTEAIELAMKKVRAELATSLSADKDSELRRGSLRAIVS